MSLESFQPLIHLHGIRSPICSYISEKPARVAPNLNLCFKVTIEDTLGAETERIRTYTYGKTPRISNDSRALGIKELFDRDIRRSG